MNKISIKTLAIIALMTAVICIIGPLSIPLPFSPVPISLTLFALFITLYVLGWKRGTVSCLIYLLIGTVGLPVFSSFSGGIGKLFGPTGGYLIGFIFTCMIAGLMIDKFFSKWYLCFVGMAVGTLACYAFGTTWLTFSTGLTFIEALWAGVIPFIPADIAKIVLALILGPILRKALSKAQLLTY